MPLRMDRRRRNRWRGNAETFYRHFIRFPSSPFLVHVIVSGRCDPACGYCSECDASSPPVPTERLEKTLRKLTSRNTYSLPLTRPALTFRTSALTTV